MTLTNVRCHFWSLQIGGEVTLATFLPIAFLCTLNVIEITAVRDYSAVGPLIQYS